MTRLLPTTTPNGTGSHALVHSSPEPEAGPQDGVIVPARGQPANRVRPTAESLVERLRIMQMQGWSREEHFR